MADPHELPPTTEPGPDPLLALDNQVCFALYASSLAMTKLYRPLLAPLGLTYPQYLVMLVLWEHGQQSVNQIGQTLQLDSGTLTPLLKRLATSGLVERRRDPQDERRVLVDLTESGHQLRDRAREVPKALVCRMGLSAAEMRQLQSTLDTLRRQLGRAEPSDVSR